MDSIRIAQTVGIGCSAWLAGNIASISLVTIPALQRSRKRDNIDATTTVRQWVNLYDIGKSQAPPFALITATALSYVAWASRNVNMQNRALAYAGSALLTVSIVPFTLITMTATIDRLAGHATWARNDASKSSSSTSGKLTDSEADNLLNKWSNLNLARSLFPLVGCMVALIMF